MLSNCSSSFQACLWLSPHGSLTPETCFSWITYGTKVFEAGIALSSSLESWNTGLVAGVLICVLPEGRTFLAQNKKQVQPSMESSSCIACDSLLLRSSDADFYSLFPCVPWGLTHAHLHKWSRNFFSGATNRFRFRNSQEVSCQCQGFVHNFLPSTRKQLLKAQPFLPQWICSQDRNICSDWSCCWRIYQIEVWKNKEYLGYFIYNKT